MKLNARQIMYMNFFKENKKRKLKLKHFISSMANLKKIASNTKEPKVECTKMHKKLLKKYKIDPHILNTYAESTRKIAPKDNINLTLHISIHNQPARLTVNNGMVHIACHPSTKSKEMINFWCNDFCDEVSVFNTHEIYSRELIDYTTEDEALIFQNEITIDDYLIRKDILKLGITLTQFYLDNNKITTTIIYNTIRSMPNVNL